MERLIATLVLVLAFSAFAAAEFQYEIVSSTPDSVSFYYDCIVHSDCMEPGREYCGENYVNTMKCTNRNLCEVTCSPITAQLVTIEWATGTYSLSPANRTVGVPVTITLKDTRNSKPLWWNVDVYYGGVWTSSFTTLKSTTSEVPQGAETVANLKTDRWGSANFTPERPGQYVIKTLGKLIKFVVADASGNVYNCGNGQCEEALGEDVYVCSADCEQPRNVTPMVPPPQVCGDGTCSSMESEQTCPQDCRPQVQQPEGPAQPPATQQQAAGDNSMTLIIILVACAAAGAIAVVFVLKSKGRKPKAAKGGATAQANTGFMAPSKCPQCGANVPAGDVFCSNCGNRPAAPQ